MLNWIMLIGGLAFLIKGSDWFVEGSSNVAKAFKIPSLIIGLTIVAFGTSAPEAAVSISASLKGNANVAIGNVMGSNIFNLLMVIGVCSCFKRLTVDNDIIKRDYPFNILVTFAFLFMIFDKFLDNQKVMTISRSDGLVLLCFLTIYMYYLIAGAIKQRQNMTFDKPSRSMGVSILFLLVGLGCVIAGGQFTVEGACGIARDFGVSENMIALTIVAIGTSLPEFVTSIAALNKGEGEIAIGNVIGSNVLNLLFIIGMSATINPLTADPTVMSDSLFLIGSNAIVYAFVCKNKSTGRAAGALMVLMYIVFATYVVIRGI